MGIMASSLLWVMQDLYHQPYVGTWTLGAWRLLGTVRRFTGQGAITMAGTWGNAGALMLRIGFWWLLIRTRV